MILTVRPGNPNFGSGPTAKRPGWSLAALEGALLGRSHRASAPKARLGEVIEGSRALLGIPASYRIGILPGSDTGAFECAMWSLLGARGIDVLAFESFGDGWLIDIEKELRLTDARAMIAPYGELPDLSAVDPDRDTVFCWNGTTSGVRVPDGDWISADRAGLTLCDATSAAFAMPAAVGQARCRDLVLAEGAGRRGAARHAGAVAAGGRSGSRAIRPAWPMPKLFRLTKGGKLIEGIFKGRDHQHAFDAGGRGRARRPALGGSDRGAAGAGRALRAQPSRDARMGRAEQLGRVPGQTP